jgi:hypothetical protein
MIVARDEIYNLDTAIQTNIDLQEILQGTLDRLQRLNKKYNNSDYLLDEEVFGEENNNNDDTLATPKFDRILSRTSTPLRPLFCNFFSPIPPFILPSSTTLQSSRSRSSSRSSHSSLSVSLRRSSSDIYTANNDISIRIIKIKRDIEAALTATENANRVHQKRNYNFVQSIYNQADGVYNAPIIIQNSMGIEKRLDELIRKLRNKYNVFQTCKADYKRLVDSVDVMDRECGESVQGTSVDFGVEI